MDFALILKQIAINFGWHPNYWRVLGFCYLEETLHFCHPYKRLDTNLLTILSVKIWKWWSAKHQEQRMNSMCGLLPSKLFTHFTKWVQMSFNQSDIMKHLYSLKKIAAKRQPHLEMAEPTCVVSPPFLIWLKMCWNVSWHCSAIRHHLTRSLERTWRLFIA